MQPSVDSFKASTTSQLLLEENEARKQALFYNDSPHTLYLQFGKKANVKDAWAVRIGPSGYYELPAPGNAPYTGDISGVWDDAASGKCQVTEIF